MPLLRCVRVNEADYILREVHEGICGNHSGGLALAQKILKQGYFWPTLTKDALLYVRKCDKCQRFATISRTTARTLTGETPFSMTYGSEAMRPVEIGIPSPRRIMFSEQTNDNLMKASLDLLFKKSDDSQTKLASY
ncbi:Integrase H2C2 domain-containing protein [Abeliophyllum distichum]|uniref:Integrase H2C2 domain-containing protein n=1 Tax=Abeliophyllum distichum TaxID=126358 RepID=A0ABD1RUM2_9LAMI